MTITSLDLRIASALLIALLAVGAGAMIAVNYVVFAAVVAGSGILVLLTFASRLSGWFLSACGVLLAGYAFFGKGFAYIRVPPAFVGELVLAIGLLAYFIASPRIRLGPIHTLLIAFMTLGLLRTLPFVSVYGIDALRDAALWYYGLFALIVGALLEKRHVEAAISWFDRFLPFLALWFAIISLFARFVVGFLPQIPGSPFRLYPSKPGDTGVFLAGVAAFLLVGFYAKPAMHKTWPTAVIWSLWAVSAGIISTQNRGGMLAIGASFLLLFLLYPNRHWLMPAACILTLALPLIVIDPSIDIGRNRDLSIGQVTENVASIFSDEEAEGLSGSKEWRLEWWGKIVDYTINGPYFWGGKGFGINLADDDGFQSDGTLRSPHSSHMSVLARMGVPGMVMWIGLQLAFLARMVGAFRRAKKHGQVLWMQVHAWILAIWIAMIVNASFDVYLEGPQAGIWFWSILGLGLATSRIQANEATRPSMPKPSARQLHAYPAGS